MHKQLGTCWDMSQSYLRVCEKPARRRFATLPSLPTYLSRQRTRTGSRQTSHHAGTPPSLVSHRREA